MNRSAEQTNRPRTASRFTRFVCPALRFIPHEPRKKDTHSLNMHRNKVHRKFGTLTKNLPLRLFILVNSFIIYAGGGGKWLKTRVDQARNPFEEKWRRGGGGARKDPAMTHRIRFRRLICPLHGNHYPFLTNRPRYKGLQWQRTRGGHVSS